MHHCDRSLLKGRSMGSSSSWLPSWWRSRDDVKTRSGSHNPGTSNPCECGLIQLRVDREDLQMPVFTTKVAPTCIIGSHHRGKNQLNCEKQCSQVGQLENRGFHKKFHQFSQKIYLKLKLQLKTFSGLNY